MHFTEIIMCIKNGHSKHTANTHALNLIVSRDENNSIINEELASGDRRIEEKPLLVKRPHLLHQLTDFV